MAHTTHWNTHVHIWRQHRTHTRMLKMSPVEIVLCFSPILSCPSSQGRSIRQPFYGAPRPGQVLVSSPWSGMDRRAICSFVFLHVFTLGFLVEETLVHT